MAKRKGMVNLEFISHQNRDIVENIFNEAIKIGVDFKLGNTLDKPVVNYRKQSGIMKDLLEPVPIQGMHMKDVMSEFKNKVLDGSVNFSSPNFLAFPDCGNSTAAMAGHVLYGMLNQNLINSIHTSPTATFVEMAVINWLRGLVGYSVIDKPNNIEDVGGINVAGGVSANMTGLLIAREKKLPGTINSGIQIDPKKIKVFIPKGIGHYSIKASIGWLGLGKDNVIEVDTTRDFIIDQKDLIKKIKSCHNDDVLLAIVAYTGDSRTMAIDDFKGIHKIAKKYNMWFHIDACHGLSLCFSNKLKHNIAGVELADSITIDPHKVLFTPYPLSYVLLKNPNDFRLVAGVSDLITKEPFSFGQITPFFGSRAFDSLKLWFLIKHLGKKRIGQLIEKRHGLVQSFEKMIAKTDEFFMMNEVTINSAVFMYVPKEFQSRLKTTDIDTIVDQINTINKSIHKRIFHEGKYYIHTFKLNDFRNVLGTGTNTEFQMLRVMPGNPLTNKSILASFLEYCAKIAEDEYNKFRNLENENTH